MLSCLATVYFLHLRASFAFRLERQLSPSPVDFALTHRQATWQQALETLTRRNVLSAPIFDRQAKAFIGLGAHFTSLLYACLCADYPTQSMWWTC